MHHTQSVVRPSDSVHCCAKRGTERCSNGVAYKFTDRCTDALSDRITHVVAFAIANTVWYCQVHLHS